MELDATLAFNCVRVSEHWAVYPPSSVFFTVKNKCNGISDTN